MDVYVCEILDRVLESDDMAVFCFCYWSIIAATRVYLPEPVDCYEYKATFHRKFPRIGGTVVGISFLSRRKR